jgi:hypothetical protein
MILGNKVRDMKVWGRYRLGNLLVSKRGLFLLILIIGLLLVIAIFQIDTSSQGFEFLASGPLAEAAESQMWYEDFEGSVDGGRHNRSGCGRQEYTSDFAYRGERSHKSEITVDPCPDNPLRYYPTFDGNFKLPALVTFWFYMDADNWNDAAGDRFSPLTVKETSGVPDARIFTTHVLSSGIMDCGHCDMSFQSKTVRVPLNRWTLQSAYVENKINSKTGQLETHVTLFVDDHLVVQGIVDNTFKEGFVKHWHMGLYADRHGDGNGVFTMYNDEMKLRSVKDLTEAEGQIHQELGTSPTCKGNGDVNGDNSANIADIQALVNDLLAPTPETPCSDLDGDKEVDLQDVQLLLDVILGNK